MERSILYFGLLLCLLIAKPTLAANANCLVRTQDSDLAIDQRDDVRFKCLRKEAKIQTLSQCLKTAQRMEYSFNRENARMHCLSVAANKKKLSFKTCQKITKQLEFADTADEIRWLCLKQATKAPTRKQCLSLASEMEYPSNSDRAEQFCRIELK